MHYIYRQFLNNKIPEILLLSLLSNNLAPLFIYCEWIIFMNSFASQI